MYYHSVDIGNLHLDGNIFAAPMAGYSDLVTRSIALKNGASLAFTEMISAEALIRYSKRTISMMRRAEGERFLAVQLFGASVEVLGRAAGIAAEIGADLLDLNAGCPVTKVIRKGAGAALGRNSLKLGLALKAMLGTGLPVTVKIRSGWDDDEQNWREAAGAAVEAGVSAIGFHPRTCRQGYGGKANWEALREISGIVPVPVIGSGDLDSPSAVLRMLKETGCHGVMIARGAVGNPEIFRDSRNLLTESEPKQLISPEDRRRNASKHLRAAAEAF
ncbi:MAG: tRNA-dihydrouridine synthase, partial [Spirochaetaceae bacterium]|nr:tRNA-dihydrouridine synthase [Spirochaetaceae bacterium]